MLKDWFGIKDVNIPFLACSNSGSDMVKLDWSLLVGGDVESKHTSQERTLRVGQQRVDRRSKSRESMEYIIVVVGSQGPFAAGGMLSQ